MIISIVEIASEIVYVDERFFEILIRYQIRIKLSFFLSFSSIEFIFLNLHLWIKYCRYFFKFKTFYLLTLDYLLTYISNLKRVLIRNMLRQIYHLEKLKSGCDSIKLTLMWKECGRIEAQDKQIKNISVSVYTILSLLFNRFVEINNSKDCHLNRWPY